MTINIIHKGLEITPAIRNYVEEKMGALKKYSDGLEHMDVEVGMATHHHQKGEVFLCKVNLTCSGELIHVERQEADLYAAIDKAQDELQEVLVRIKKRQEDRDQGKG